MFLSLTDYSRKTDLSQSHRSGFRTQAFKEIKSIALNYLQEVSLPLPVYTEHIPTYPWFSHTVYIPC